MKKYYDVERQFGFLFSLIIAVFSVLFFDLPSLGLFFFLGVSLALLATAIKSPSSLIVPSVLWLRFGKLLAIVVSPIVLLLLYSAVFGLTALITKPFGYDPLLRKSRTNGSFWRVRQSQPSKMGNPW